jgi:hypothetical protein
VAGGAHHPLGQGGADEGKPGSHDDDLVFLDILGDGVSLTLLLGDFILSHFDLPPYSF